MTHNHQFFTFYADQKQHGKYPHLTSTINMAMCSCGANRIWKTASLDPTGPPVVSTTTIIYPEDSKDAAREYLNITLRHNEAVDNYQKNAGV